MNYAEGVLVRWPRGKSEVGVVAQLLQGGKQLRARFDDGSEQIFAVSSPVITRFLFKPGDPVQSLSGGDVGVVKTGQLVGQKIYYSVLSVSTMSRAVREKLGWSYKKRRWRPPNATRRREVLGGSA